LQAFQAALAVILTPELRRMGQQDFHEIFPSIAKRTWQRGADRRHERHDQ
jgi:hypothetical protein